MSILEERLQGNTTTNQAGNRVLRGPYFTRFSHRGEKASEEDILTHLTGVHLEPPVLVRFGVPVYDIDLCAYKEISLEPVVNEIYRKLTADAEWKAAQLVLIKTLRYIHERGLYEIDWERVEKIRPGASEIAVNFPMDSPGEEEMGDLNV